MHPTTLSARFDGLLMAFSISNCYERRPQLGQFCNNCFSKAGQELEENDPFSIVALCFHNWYREAANLDLVSWNSNLARSAAKWAAELQKDKGCAYTRCKLTSFFILSLSPTHTHTHTHTQHTHTHFPPPTYVSVLQKTFLFPDFHSAKPITIEDVYVC